MKYHLNEVRAGNQEALKRKHRAAEAGSMFSGGEKTICGIDNPLKNL
jgi:hypothetical protein